MGDNEKNDATDDAKRVENETPTTGITSIELVERDSSYPARKLSSGKRKWINLRESVRRSEAISDDTKRIMEAYHALDDLTVIPTKTRLWSHQNAKSNLLILLVPAAVTALWLCIPLNPWYYEQWRNDNLILYGVYAFVYAIFQGLCITQFFNSVMPLSKCHQLAIATFVATATIALAFISGLVAGSFFFENCVFAAIAWDLFCALGVGFSFIWVTIVLFKMIKKASVETHTVLKAAQSYKSLYEHTSKNISTTKHFHGQLQDIASTLVRQIHEDIINHHVQQTREYEKAKSKANTIALHNAMNEDENQAAAEREILALSTKFRLEIAERLNKIAEDFTMQKKWQLAMTMLVVFICGVTYWSLTVFVAWWVSASHDPLMKAYQTIAYHSVIILFEWLACLCADMVDVAQITTVTPGVLAGAQNRKFDDFKFYRLSTRVMYYFSFVRRAFYIPLFVQINDWGEWVAMTLVSMIIIIGFQIILRSPRYYQFMEWYIGNCWPMVPYRSYKTCLDQACLYNYFDFVNVFSCLLQFMVAYVFCTMSYNSQSFDHFFTSFDWNTILYVLAWTIMQCLYCLIILTYEAKVPRKFKQRIPKPTAEGALCLKYDEGVEKIYITDPLEVLKHVYKSGDTILFSMIIIAIHVSQNPYFAFTLHNLSSTPCTDLIKSATMNITNATSA
eukprot:g645.t1